MWQIRKVYVVRAGQFQITYCGENEERATQTASRVQPEYRRVEPTMVAVRLEAGKVVEVQYLAKCVDDRLPDPLEGAEIDIAPEDTRAEHGAGCD